MALDLLPGAVRLLEAGPDRAPRPARPALVRDLAGLLQQRRDRRLGAALLPAAALPARAHALDRVPGQHRRAAAVARAQVGRRPLRGPRGLPADDQHRRLGRDRRRLRGRDRRRQDHRREPDLRRGLVPRRQPDRRHLRARQLLRLRAVRGDLPVERQLGRARRGPRRGDLLRPRDPRRPDRPRPAARRPPPRRDPGPGLARLSVLGLRPAVELERLADLGAARLEPRPVRPPARPRRPARGRGGGEVRPGRAGAAVRGRRARPDRLAPAARRAGGRSCSSAAPSSSPPACSSRTRRSTPAWRPSTSARSAARPSASRRSRSGARPISAACTPRSRSSPWRSP